MFIISRRYRHGLFFQVNHDGVYGRIISETNHIRQKIQMNLKRVIFQNGREQSTKQVSSKKKLSQLS